MTLITTPSEQQDAPASTPAEPPRSFGWSQLVQALPGALRKLNPASLLRNPVMLLVWVGAAFTTVLAIAEPFLGGPADSGGTPVPAPFTWGIAIWLWLTVLFANVAESVAEGRGKAQAASLRKTRTSTMARRVVGYEPSTDAAAEHAATAQVSSAELQRDDIVIVTAGELIPGDGDIIAGIATVDESAITGESAPVIRESGGDRSAVTGGTRVLSDRIVVRITSKPGETFVDRMIALVEGASRQRTPNEIALNILLASLSIIFVVVVLALNPIASYAASPVSIPVLIALLVCLIPTTIGALLSAIGIAGMDRLVQRNVLAMSGRAVEAAGDVTTLLLDKTGTITYGNRRAHEVLALPGVNGEELLRVAALSSLADPTPEGASIVELAAVHDIHVTAPDDAVVVPFTAQTRMSGLDLADGTQIRKGAGSAVRAWLGFDGDDLELTSRTDSVAESGGTPLVVAVKTPGADGRVLGVVHLKDIVKDGLRERFEELRAMGIRTVMITGDNPLTAKAIAAEAGVDDFLAEATPEDKLELIRREQEGGRLVAMTGDGTNDAPALAQADVGVAMNTGTSAAKEAGNMVDLDSDPTKLIDIVRIGKQLLITRGALTTFSLANDIAKYFAIIPAMFMGVFPGLAALNIMQLHSPASAVTSAIIFNAIVIVFLIPLALRGVKYRPASASQILQRNLLVYGLGGVIAPFIGIKIIDLVVSLIPGF
ncbi:MULTISPECIES: potassium-transporting ATPase subunit KdpB [unclassified Microbacterium]|uniref:potassium-transporting ATPase subunit KdpB n=1 Tax=unclassified Microbacterium TaxID=2609290 RepID=UPI000CFC38F7|nr:MULTISPECIES: potassium-transporting ATPase subunit KdpB [unclassified Microbacterium]PQZ55369.1 K(+)-transporting ATPase subunit B [Microbacterium sp. MYb43]PQZ76405.1 K(+)-transporting ATPase subunit B [Microbacterium sp. MYb40]PRB21149.1 K(+)-transporting ATPase subunit B [Microbacterium sp. MYb54]PRB26331.1 K(+)-transporting ATPase subunit B [Microbacterium sp. MYb50]PRB66970.1 K(+)-transporting ATPase subunit B [Microbacterium sp. MYb24]